jgi:hypothetical protein
MNRFLLHYSTQKKWEGLDLVNWLVEFSTSPGNLVLGMVVNNQVSLQRDVSNYISGTIIHFTAVEDFQTNITLRTIDQVTFWENVKLFGHNKQWVAPKIHGLMI